MELIAPLSAAGFFCLYDRVFIFQAYGDFLYPVNACKCLFYGSCAV